MKTDSRPPSPFASIDPSAGYLRPGLVYVDDSVTALQTMRRALYPHRIVLETFTSGSALAARGPEPLVAALLDVDLGHGESGLELAQSLRAAHPALPIAFITASTDAARREDLSRVGPVFAKDTDRPAAVAWLLSHVETPAGEPR